MNSKKNSPHNWAEITKDVENYVAKCESCQKNKLSRKIAPLIITDTSSKPFEKCALDIVGPLIITTQENKYLLTFQDSLTKFSKAISIPNQEANTISKELQKLYLNTEFQKKFYSIKAQTRTRVSC